MPLLANVEPKNGVRWHRLMVPFERLPMEPLEGVRIGVQYLGTGTVWLDDIVLHHVLFSENEKAELQKMLVVAVQRSSSGRVSDLTSLLEGHWGRFLFQHIPTPAAQPVISAPKPPAATAAAPPKPPTLYQRAKGWVGLK